MSWSATFKEPVPLPDGGELRTLDDARAYLIRLPNGTLTQPYWQTALAALLLIGEHGGPTDLVRIGFMHALYPTGATSRKDRQWRHERRILTRVIRAARDY